MSKKTNAHVTPTPEQLSAINRQIARNLLIFVGIKALTYYGIYRLAKAVKNLDN